MTNKRVEKFVEKSWILDSEKLRTYRNRDMRPGSFYELSLVLSDEFKEIENRKSLLFSLWNDYALKGVVTNLQEFGSSWQQLKDVQVKDNYRYYGCLRISSEVIVGCHSSFFSISEVNWFSLSIPLAMLDTTFQVMYPLSRPENKVWKSNIDTTLISIGRRIYAANPFKLALIGEEASATPVESIARLRSILETDEALLVPDDLYTRLDVAPRGVRFPEGLWWTGE